MLVNLETCCLVYFWKLKQVFVFVFFQVLFNNLMIINNNKPDIIYMCLIDKKFKWIMETQPGEKRQKIGVCLALKNTHCRIKITYASYHYSTTHH